ncbi:MAG TPA: hypothetical protein VNI77_03535 [Nitrososphaera sp.]|nr:hypothetical protein [Nitrososphaera sp.]
MPDYHVLGLGNAFSVITKVEVKLWGNELCISCLYDPSISRQQYQLLFRNTQEIQWNVHDTDELESPMIGLTGFILGEGKHRKPALITTNVFEISVLYESLSIQIGSEVREVLRQTL